MPINKEEFSAEITKHLNKLDAFFIDAKPLKHMWEVMTKADVVIVELPLKDSNNYELKVLFPEWEEALPYLDQDDSALDTEQMVYRIKTNTNKDAIKVLLFLLNPLLLPEAADDQHISEQ